MKKRITTTLFLLACTSALALGLTACEYKGCSHVMQHFDETAATCTMDGNHEYWHCTECRLNFSDAEGRTEIKDIVIPKAHVLAHSEKVDESCTSDGSNEYWRCTVCNKFFSDRGFSEVTQESLIIKASHKFEDGLCEVCQALAPYGSTGIDYTDFDSNGGAVRQTNVGAKGKSILVIASEWYNKPVVSVGRGAFKNSKVEKFYIPETVKYIGREAFYACSKITEMILPDSVVRISEDAFSQCAALKTVKADGVITINDGAFSGCASLTSISLPSLTTLGISVFNDCTSLTSITFSNKLTSIGMYAFSGCSKLTVINFKGTKAEWDAIRKQSNWDYGLNGCTVRCTDGEINIVAH